jgi:hypothetical protein
MDIPGSSVNVATQGDAVAQHVSDEYAADSHGELSWLDLATADAEDAASVQRSWMPSEYDQIDGGAFAGRFQQASFQDTLVAAERQNRTVLKRLYFPPDYCSVSLVRSVSVRCPFGGDATSTLFPKELSATCPRTMTMKCFCRRARSSMFGSAKTSFYRQPTPRVTCRETLAPRAVVKRSRRTRWLPRERFVVGLTAQLSCPLGGASQSGAPSEIGGRVLFHFHQCEIQSGNQFLCLVWRKNEGVLTRRLR